MTSISDSDLEKLKELSEFHEFVTAIRERTGMYLLGRSFNEIYAVLLGFQLGSKSSVLILFKEWLMIAAPGKPEWAWPMHIFQTAFPDGSVTSVVNHDQDEQAKRVLFNLLDEFLRQAIDELRGRISPSDPG